MDRKKLYENSIIIAPKELHPYLLEYRSAFPEADLSFQSLGDLEGLFLYHYDARAIMRLCVDEKFTYGYAKDVLGTIIHFKAGVTYKSPKLNSLKPIFEKLLNEGLLYSTPNPEMSLKGKNVVISGYHSATRIYNAWRDVPNVSSLFDTPLYEEKKFPEVLQFEDLYGECHYVVNKIANLIAQGVEPSSIYLRGYQEEYHLTLSLLSDEYGFTIDFPSNKSLGETWIARRFLEAFKEGNPLLNGNLERAAYALEILEGEFDEELDLNLLQKTVHDYGSDQIPLDEQIKLYLSVFADQKASKPRLSNAVQILDSNFPPYDSHIFYLNFCIDTSPKVHKDDRFLLDSELRELWMLDSGERSKEEKTDLLALLRYPGLEAVTYKASYLENSYFPSPLVEELKLKRKNPSLEYEYSRAFTKLWAASILDEKKRVGRKDERYPFLKKESGYDERTFSYAFSGADVHRPDSPIRLSYSAVNSYNECPFKYYASRVLGCDDSEDGFALLIGNLCHRILENDYMSPSFDVEKAYKEAKDYVESESRKFTPKEEVLLKKVEKGIKTTLLTLREKEGRIVNPVYFRELECKVDLEDGVSVSGRIDKAIVSGEAKKYLSIVDYKTSSATFDPDYVSQGFSLQLPVYALFGKKDQKLRDYELFGLFISPLMPKATKDQKDSLDESFAAMVKLDGVYLGEEEAIQTIDPNKEDPYLAKSPYGKTGEFKPKKEALTAEQLEELSNEAERQIRIAANNIRANQFPVDPVEFVAKRTDGCAFCSFRDICHRPRDEEITRKVRPATEEKEAEDVQ